MKEKKQFIINLHDNNGMTYQEIGNSLGISRQRVHQIVHDYNTYNNKYIREELGINNCEICSISGDYCKLTVHHKDKDINNNTQYNIQILCMRCHKMVEVYRKDTIRNHTYRERILKDNICKHCGNKFLYKKIKTFCSRECFRLYRRMVRKSNISQCINCGIKIETFSYYQKKYCTLDCRRQHQQTYQTIKCKRCGKDTTDYRRLKRIFCSNECHRKYEKENHIQC